MADKYYPVQGTNKFKTVSFPITKAFVIDCAAATVGTHTLFTVPKGAQVSGWTARVVESVESEGSGTIQLGFAGVGGLQTAALASGAATAGTVLTASSNTVLTSNTSYQIPVVLTANDTFDFIVATTNLSAGQIDVFLTYTPIPVDDLSTDEFLTYTIA